MIRRLFALLLCAALLGAGTACGVILDAASDIADAVELGGASDTPDTPEHTATTTLTPAPAVADASDSSPAPAHDAVGDVEKFNAYVGASGVLTGRVRLCLSEYEERICALDKDYVVNKQTFNGGISGIGHSERTTLNTALEYAYAAPSMEPVDGMYVALAPVALEIIDILDAIYAYYDANGYEDDNFAMGKELHGALRARVGAYYELSQDFTAALSALSHERVVQSLDSFMQEGRALLYHANMFILCAEELCAYLSGTVASGKDELNVGAADYRALYDPLAAAHADFTAAATVEQIEAEGFGASFGTFMSAADGFKADADAIAQSLNDGRRVTAGEAAGLIEKYEALVSAYNAMLR